MNTATLKPALGTALERVKTMFLEVPGTQLSVADASVLAGLDRDTCRIFLGWLEDSRFLRRTSQGLYTRRASDASPEDDGADARPMRGQ